MTRLPHTLTQMTISGRSMRVPRYFEDVYRRAAVGRGTFITREQIDSLNPLDVLSILAYVKGVQTFNRGVKFSGCPDINYGEVYVDGERLTRFSTLNDALRMVTPRAIQAMEIYTRQSAVPGEFLDAQPCAVVAIWTKRGP